MHTLNETIFLICLQKRNRPDHDHLELKEFSFKLLYHIKKLLGLSVSKCCQTYLLFVHGGDCVWNNIITSQLFFRGLKNCSIRSDMNSPLLNNQSTDTICFNPLLTVFLNLPFLLLTSYSTIMNDVTKCGTSTPLAIFT